MNVTGTALCLAVFLSALITAGVMYTVLVVREHWINLRAVLQFLIPVAYLVVVVFVFVLFMREIQ